MTTAHDASETRRAALADGAVAFVAKPLRDDGLLAVVHRALSR